MTARARDQSKYKNVTLNDFLQIKTTLPVISLRHDIDGKINSALKIAEIEYKHNIIATYFILHTAEYYGTTEKNYVKHNEEIIPLPPFDQIADCARATLCKI